MDDAKALAKLVRQYLRESPLERNMKMIELAARLERSVNQILGVPKQPKQPKKKARRTSCPF